MFERIFKNIKTSIVAAILFGTALSLLIFDVITAKESLIGLGIVLYFLFSKDDKIDGFFNKFKK